MKTPMYIKNLLAPTVKKQTGRKVWSVDLETVWLPFFRATNTMGDSAIPSEALGAPLRLGYDKAGQVRFSSSGRPVIKVAKEITESVTMVRENFVANLQSYAGQVAKDNPDGYKAQIEMANKAGLPILQHDREQLSKAYEAIAEAEAEAKLEAELKAEAEANAKTEAEAEAERETASKNERELVPA